MKKTGVLAGVAAVLFSCGLSWAGVEDDNYYLWFAKSSWHGYERDCVDVEDDCLWVGERAGKWKTDGKHGFYRAMVYSKPGETGSSDKVVIDILERDDEGLSITKRGSIDLGVPSYRGYIWDISFNTIDDQIMAVLIDVWMNGMNGMVLREVFLISPNGAAKLAVEASYQDVFEPLPDD